MTQETRRQFITAIDLYLLSVVALIQVGSWFSFLGMRLFLADGVAFVAYHLSRTKRRQSEQNLSQTFAGKLSKDRLRKILKSSFHQFWLEAFSMPSPSLPEAGRMQLTIRGLEHLQRAMDSGKGAILWETSCFGRRSLAKQILHQNGFSVHQVYGDNRAGGFCSPCPASWLRRRIIKRFFDNCEKQYVAEILELPLWEPLPVMRALFKRLKQNGIICVAGDSTLGWNGVHKRFLGVNRVFATGMVNLSRITGAPILPLFCIQESNDEIAVIVEPPIRVDSNIDRDSASEMGIAQYVSLLESYVKRHPGQYYDWHFASVSGANSIRASVVHDPAMEPPAT